MPGDVVAGFSVALVLIPQALAYAQLAGLPPHHGLFAAALPALAAAAVASSPYLQTGPTAVTSLLTFGALGTLAAPGSEAYVGLALLLAVLVGLVRLAAGLLRAGVAAYLLSPPMLMGFVPAAAILIVASQLPAAVGAAAPEGGVLERGAWALAHPGSWEVASLILSLATVVLVLGAGRLHVLFPGVLVAAGLGLAYSAVVGYEGPAVGAVPSGLPPLSVDLPWREAPSLLVPAAVIAIVGFAEPAAIARRFAALERRRWDADREFASQGVANVVAGLSGGFPVGGSFSRSSLNRLAGARTRWSGAVTGLVVLAFLPFTWIVSPLPSAVLAAVVIAAVVSLIRVAPMLRLFRYSRLQFGVAATTFALTLALAPRVERAVVIGVVLAVAVHLWRELSLEVASSASGDTLHLIPSGVLWFGTARRLEDAFLTHLAEHGGARRLAVHLDRLGRIDLTGALALQGLLQDARAAGLDVEVVDVRPRWRGLVARVIEREDDPVGGAIG